MYKWVIGSMSAGGYKLQDDYTKWLVVKVGDDEEKIRGVVIGWHFANV